MSPRTNKYNNNNQIGSLPLHQLRRRIPLRTTPLSGFRTASGCRPGGFLCMLALRVASSVRGVCGTSVGLSGAGAARTAAPLRQGTFSTDPPATGIHSPICLTVPFYPLRVGRSGHMERLAGRSSKLNVRFEDRLSNPVLFARTASPMRWRVARAVPVLGSDILLGQLALPPYGGGQGHQQRWQRGQDMALRPPVSVCSHTAALPTAVHRLLSGGGRRPSISVARSAFGLTAQLANDEGMGGAPLVGRLLDGITQGTRPRLPYMVRICPVWCCRSWVGWPFNWQVLRRDRPLEFQAWCMLRAI